MFDFQKLLVYDKSKTFNQQVNLILKNHKFDKVTRDQLRRASFSIMLNIAEGSSRFSNRDRRNFLVISRGSAFECVAIFEYLYENKEIEEKTYLEIFSLLEEISKMLNTLIKKLN